jgi:hypothetical protein
VAPSFIDNSLLSIAVMEPFEGSEDEFLRVLRELYALLEGKGYSRDELFRNRMTPPQYFNFRRWVTPQARLDAHEDPEVHRYWAQLGHLCHMRRVHETLDEVDWRAEKSADPSE